MVRKAEFNLQSALSADLKDLSLDKDVTVSLGFKSTQSQGLLLRDKQPVGTGVCFGSRCRMADVAAVVSKCVWFFSAPG